MSTHQRQAEINRVLVVGNYFRVVSGQGVKGIWLPVTPTKMEKEGTKEIYDGTYQLWEPLMPSPPWRR